MNILNLISDLLIDYGPVTITAGIALFYLHKDWKSFDKGIFRWLVLIFICLLLVVGVLNIYHTDKKNALQRADDKAQIDSLTSAVKTANKSQEDNTKQFIVAFGKLSQEVSNLKGDVKTAGLRERANNLEAELKATQKSLEPKKAVLAFTFIDSADRPDSDKIIREITLPVKDDVIHVEYKMINDSDVDARNLEIILTICDECEFASEPLGSKDFAGRPTRQRNIAADFGVYKKSISRHLSVDIKVPPHASAVMFAADYRCETCDVQGLKENTGIINLRR